uniref:(northern house mosquito) hypothetical protein n=1 Tax=Culex pipiens TaxID=7175 RepID=A0A8D8J1C9_CULPI
MAKTGIWTGCTRWRRTRTGTSLMRVGAGVTTRTTRKVTAAAASLKPVVAQIVARRVEWQSTASDDGRPTLARASRTISGTCTTRRSGSCRRDCRRLSRLMATCSRQRLPTLSR